MQFPPRIQIAALPTPVEEMPRLSAALGGPRLLVKRDDLTGLGFGGNKARKLEFLMAEARASAARTLITVGAAQSNHARQVAALAARLGLDCILVLSGEAPQTPTGNLLLDRLFGAQIVWCSRPQRDQVLQDVFEEAQRAGRQPYKMPLGGSTPTGALGYVFAMQELVNQGIQADWIVVPSSSAGTVAGMLLGARLFGFKGQVLSISIDHPALELKEATLWLANQAAQLLKAGVTVHPQDVHVNDDYLGQGYGMLGDAEVEAIRLFARQEGLLLDPVYTGRAAAGLIDLIRKGQSMPCPYFKPGETVLFWHTGGTPALFAEDYIQDLGQEPTCQPES